jgi:hypothetical protein
MMLSLIVLTLNSGRRLRHRRPGALGDGSGWIVQAAWIT